LVENVDVYTQLAFTLYSCLCAFIFATERSLLDMNIAFFVSCHFPIKCGSLSQIITLLSRTIKINWRFSFNTYNNVHRKT